MYLSDNNVAGKAVNFVKKIGVAVQMRKDDENLESHKLVCIQPVVSPTILSFHKGLL
jgi:hypothetical protein